MDGGPMAGHVVIAPDRFKGSLTAAEAAHAIALGLKRPDPTLTTVQCPVADGGDGTLGTVLAAGFQQIPIYATGPTGQVVRTAYAHPDIGCASFTLAVDVDNPLYGPLGAASVYAPQKGANPDQVIELDHSLRRWADVVEEATKTGCRSAAGAGAAGGVGFAALAVLGARMKPGIEVIVDRIELDKHLQGARAVVTGEGSLDRQSLRGKAAVGVCRRASGHGVPTFAVAGVSALTPAEVHAAGFADVYPLSDLEPDPVRSMDRAAELLAAVSEQLGRMLAA